MKLHVINRSLIRVKIYLIPRKHLVRGVIILLPFRRIRAIKVLMQAFQSNLIGPFV